MKSTHILVGPEQTVIIHPSITKPQHEQSSIARALCKVKDSDQVKKASSIMTESCWRINQILTPEALKTVEINEIKHVFMRVALSQIKSTEHEKEVRELDGKVRSMENRAIGGGWL